MENVKPPFRVLVAGASYGGIGVVLNLLDLCHGNAPRYDSTRVPPQIEIPKSIPIEITIVDERDGFCMSCGSFLVSYAV